MNYIDISIITIMLFFIIKGLIKGFTREIMGILSFIIAFYAALSQMKMMANILNEYFHNYSISLIVGYIIVFLFVFIIIHIIARAITRLLNVTSLGWLNRLGGGIFGLLFGGMLISLIVAMLSILPLSNIPPGKQNSKLYPYVEKIAPKLFDAYMKLFPESQSFMNDITQKIVSEKLMKSGMDGNNMELLKNIDMNKLMDNFKGIDMNKVKQSLGSSGAPDSAVQGAYKELFDKFNLGSGEQKSIEEIIKGSKKK